MAEEKKLLEIENLRKYFPVNGIKGPGVQAVQDVSLYIKKGETLGLVGESGCGHQPQKQGEKSDFSAHINLNLLSLSSPKVINAIQRPKYYKNFFC